MWFLKNLLLLTLLATIIAIVYSATDSDCKTPDDRPGLCVFDSECPSLLNIKNNTTRTRDDILFFSRSYCGRVNENLKVCCTPKNTTLCPNIVESTVRLACHFEGKIIPCSDSIRNNAIVYPSCMPLHEPFRANYLNPLNCVNGSWDGPLPRCVRSCTGEWKCDAYLYIKDRIYPVNSQRVIISSEYIEKVFNHSVKEAVIQGISEFDSATVQAVIDFMHTEKTDTWKINQLAGIMFISEHLNVRRIKKACDSFLKQTLNDKNYVELLKASKELNVSMLIEAVDFYMEDNFKTLILGDQWLELDVTGISEILQSDHLNVDSEEQVFTGLLKWLNYNQQRKTYTIDLLKTIRMNQLSPRFILSKVNPLCTEDLPECYNLVLNAVNRNNTEMSTKRKKMVNPWTVLIVGGFFDDKVGNVETYNHETDSWSIFAEIDLTTGYSAVILDGKLFRFGGKENYQLTNKVNSYDLATKQSTELPPMKYYRRHSAAAVLNGLIYVCGGISQNVNKKWVVFDEVERFDPKTNTWTDVKKMPTKRYSHSIVTWKDKMYVAGGRNESDYYLNTLDIYDPNLDQWTSGPPMEIERADFAFAATDEGLFSVGGSRTSPAELLKFGTQKWKTIDVPPAEFVYSSGVALDRKIIVTAGSDESFEFNPRTEEWTKLNERSVGRTHPIMLLVSQTLVYK